MYDDFLSHEYSAEAEKNDLFDCFFVCISNFRFSVAVVVG